MFGFGNNRERWNGAINDSLNTNYGIQTRDNPKFPAMLAYLEFLDQAWQAKMSQQEGAMYMATLYYCGIVDHGLYQEAEELLPRIRHASSMATVLAPGSIRKAHMDRFMSAIAQALVKIPASHVQSVVDNDLAVVGESQGNEIPPIPIISSASAPEPDLRVSFEADIWFEEQHTRLGDAYDDGSISDDEYRAAKKKLILDECSALIDRRFQATELL